MQETNDLQEYLRKEKAKITLPFVVALVGVLIAVIALLLPYMTAVGDLAEYIEKYPDVILEETVGLTTSDFANVSMISVRNLVASVYGKDNGSFVAGIVIVFGIFLALTALFVVLKKPIGAMIFSLPAYGVFFVLNSLMKEFHIAADKYAWGIGYYAMTISIIAIFVGAVWMLVTKIMIKRQAKKAMMASLIE